MDSVVYGSTYGLNAIDRDMSTQPMPLEVYGTLYFYFVRYVSLCVLS